MKNQKGVTLIALIITVIVMLILAAVTVSQITDADGLLSKTQLAGEAYNETSLEEEEYLKKLTAAWEQLNSSIGDYQDVSGANAPELLTGMTAVTFDESTGSTIPVTDKSEWYDYSTKKWANAQTEDGSLWVWIPRFAYKITYTNDLDKSKGGTIDVVFLDEDTSLYYKLVDNTLQLTVATEDNYIIHPSFRKAVNGDYSHGEWDEELTGYWVAKFEAGWQQGDANATTTNPNDKTKAIASSLAFQNNPNTARYLNNITNITYPVFKGATYAMNYMTIADMFSICRHLTETYTDTQGNTTNFYGLSETDADSHLMKNSEWGACAYLGYSQYGTEGTEVHINNVNLNNSITGIYAVTGYGATNASANVVTSLASSNIWYTEAGQKSSNNHNITGVYGMSGGAWDRVAGYVANGDGNLSTYGTVVSTETDKLVATTTASNDVTKLSTKYSTIYRYGSENTAAANYNANRDTGMYGDATIETSSSSATTSATSWNLDYSVFAFGTTPFIVRGGNFNESTSSGLFSFQRTTGEPPNVGQSFRAVLCPK